MLHVQAVAAPGSPAKSDGLLEPVLAELRDATDCAEAKLNTERTNWGNVVADFDADPEKTLLTLARRLRELVAAL